ncbi:MAG: SIS domain-containing protein [Erysipelotrichaceae bacterium]
MIFNMDDNQLKNLVCEYTAKEIKQQPATWAKTLKQVENMKEELAQFINQVTSQEDYDIILTGAGTSEFVGNSAYSYLNRHMGNYKVKSYGTTDLVATPYNYLSKTKPTLLISYGRSGNSPESIGAVNVAEDVCENLYHIFITCNKDGALSKRAETMDNAIAINLTDETHDKSFAMTSSYTNMYLATILSFNLDNLDTMNTYMNTVISSTDRLHENSQYIKTIIDEFNFNRIVYLGANCLKGVAQESALKMLELTAGKVATMYDTPLGFRHGPKSIINPETLTVIYLSDDAYSYQYELDLIKEMAPQRRGNKILAVSSKERPELNELVDYFVSFDNNIDLDNVFLGLQFVNVAQIISLFKSLSYGITTDNPCPTGEVNRVVKGVTLYPLNK